MQIGYKIGGSFEDCCRNNNPDIQFEIVFPCVYNSYEDAKKNISNIRADMVKVTDVVVIRLYEKENLVDTIKWDEYWKYSCSQLKESAIESGLVDARIDYEPCSMKFEKIFIEYTDNWNVEIFNLQYLAYWIEPTIIMENDGSFSFVKNN